jgi:hypothetical protein
MTRPADLDYIEELKARIEALEAALRKIEINVEASMDVFMRTRAIASAALAPEQK